MTSFFKILRTAAFSALVAGAATDASINTVRADAAVAAAPAVGPASFNNGSVPINTPASARRLINDLITTHGSAYAKGHDFLRRLDALEKAPKLNQVALEALIRDAALANPILDFDKILCVRRKPGAGGLGFMHLNSHCEDDITRTGWDNEIVLLSNLRAAKPTLTSVYRAPNTGIIRDLDLHFDGQKFLFASTNKQGNWAVFEMGVDGKNPRELTPNDQPDIQWFDPCYLAEEGSILAFSTAGIQGVPCENGGNKVSSLYRINTAAKNAAGQPDVRQLTFEQDSGWHPRTLNDGRVMYLRWQYTDTPHYFDRVLFTMLPDGRQQKALWGSGSYFPTAYKHARPIPGHPSMLLGVAGSHHGQAEVGRLLLVDPALGTHYPFRHEAKSKSWGEEGSVLEIPARIYPKEVTGCVQEIPGWGRDVVGNVKDGQGDGQTYTFAFPYPLNEKYFLTSLRKRGSRNFAIYLVDRFDNFVKLCELPGDNLFEPLPLVRRERPRNIPSKIDPASTEGTMFVSDVYQGRGLPGIPRGKAKSLRIIAYNFAYWQRGGHHSVGEESSWDIKRILGTVPVEADGSAFFKVPANTPIAMQVLDEDGAAIQLMQSWTIAMPGEHVSCAGCHEGTNSAIPSMGSSIASHKPPRTIAPWYGAFDRPFGFEVEIQPLLDKYCVSCHNDQNKKATSIISFTQHGAGAWNTDTAYRALHPYVRRPGPESGIDTKVPMDFHASNSELIQRLKRGHYGVAAKLDREAWERLYTWIDLNAPYRGTWSFEKLEKRRSDLQKLYAGNTADPDALYRELLKTTQANAAKGPKAVPVPPAKIKALLAPSTDDAIGALPKNVADNVRAKGWPFDNAAARQGKNATLDIPLGNGKSVRFVRIPAGQFVIGSTDGFSDERPRSTVQIKKAFWIAESELTNSQYASFDPEHDTGYESENGKDHVTPGFIANHADQPVARVSWQESMRFCQWLSKKTGKKVTLPTEAQWEWAARAGTATPFYFGDRVADFSEYANLADAGLRRTARGYPGGSCLAVYSNYPVNYPYPLRDDRFTDKYHTVDYVKQYKPNAWGLYDTIGNVWEWTRSDYAPYPYKDTDGRNTGDLAKKKVARGGSHNDRPKAIGAAVRIPYETYQRIHNVGFRPIIEE